MKLDSSDRALRQSSPVYRPDDDWEALPPQSMDIVISVRFDASMARRLAEIARQSGLSISGLIRSWTTRRLEALAESGGEDRKVGEVSQPYVASSDDYESLRQRYRPRAVRLLLVGESRPAGGTFFYLANSNLFFSTRDAFNAALGPMPLGAGFLGYLAEHGVWLVDAAAKPVNRLPGRPRRAVVESRAADLAQVLRETSPEVVVAIKRDLEPTVREAMRLADTDLDRLAVLPFPLYQWRREYVSGLARIVRQLDSF